MKANLNNYVKVKLNRKGVRFHREYFLDKYMNQTFDYTEPSVDKDGYSLFHLWEFMHIFGKHLYNGCQMPCETDIIVVTES